MKALKKCNTCTEIVDESLGYEEIRIYDYKLKKMRYEYRCKTCYDKKHNKWWRRMFRRIDDWSEKL